MKKIESFGSRKEWMDFVWSEILKDIKNPRSAAIFNALMTAHEKEIFVNRLAAISRIKRGDGYREISEELWLSPTTIGSLKKLITNNSNKEYESYNKFKSKNKPAEKIHNKSQFDFDYLIPAWLEYYMSVYPKKNGPRWKFHKKTL